MALAILIGDYRGFITIVSFEGAENIKEAVDRLENLGFQPLPLNLGAVANFSPTDLLAPSPQSRAPTCPVHGQEKISVDKRDGGFYCGVKVDNVWCGAKFSVSGQLTRPSKFTASGGSSAADIPASRQPDFEF